MHLTILRSQKGHLTLDTVPSQLCSSPLCLLLLTRQFSAQNLARRRLRQVLQLKHPAAQFLVSCDLLICPFADLGQELLFLRRRCVRGESYVRDRQLGSLFVGVDRRYCRVDYRG